MTMHYVHPQQVSTQGLHRGGGGGGSVTPNDNPCAAWTPIHHRYTPTNIPNARYGSIRGHNDIQRQQQHGPELENDGYQIVRSRRNRRIHGRSTTATGGLAGAPIPTRKIWISRTITSDAEIVKTFLTDRNIEVHDINKVSHESFKYYSYKISISVNAMGIIFDDNFWPNGVRCELWRDKRYRNHNSSDIGSNSGTYNNGNNDNEDDYNDERRSYFMYNY